MSHPKDVGLLLGNKIIENYFGTNEEIAKFFNNVGKDVAFNIKSNYLLGLFTEVNDYCRSGWHVVWGRVKEFLF